MTSETCLVPRDFTQEDRDLQDPVRTGEEDESRVRVDFAGASPEEPHLGRCGAEAPGKNGPGAGREPAGKVSSTPPTPPPGPLLVPGSGRTVLSKLACPCLSKM